MADIIRAIAEIKKIVTCQIHLGLVENPKKLFCQHVFCEKCLKERFETIPQIICWTCKKEDSRSNVDDLPSAIFEKNITKILSADIGDMNKLKQIIELVECTFDFITMRDPRYLHCQHAFCYQCLQKYFADGVSRNCPLCRNPSPTSSANEIPLALTQTQLIDIISNYDFKSLKDKMDDERHFKLDQRDNITDILRNYEGENIPKGSNLVFFYVDIDSFVLVNTDNNFLIVGTKTELKVFQLNLGFETVRPHFIKICGGYLIVSGTIERKNGIIIILLRCEMSGKILLKYEFSPLAGRIQMTMGFDINSTDGKCYLCLPELNRIVVFNRDLQLTDDSYEFSDTTPQMSPEYVAYRCSDNRLWVSCPTNQRILILNVESKGFRTIDVTTILIPKMITITEQNQIIMLDGLKNRLIMIEIIIEEIVNTILSLPSLSKNISINAFRVSQCSSIIIGTNTEKIKYNPRIPVKNKF